MGKRARKKESLELAAPQGGELHMAKAATRGTKGAKNSKRETAGSLGVLDLNITISNHQELRTMQAILAQNCDSHAEVRRHLGALAQNLGPRVPGLTHGLTHLFPSAEVLANGELAMLGLPPTAVKSLTELTAGVARGDIVLHHGVPRAALLASLTMVSGIEPATAHQIALRLGHREPVPGVDEASPSA